MFHVKHTVILSSIRIIVLFFDQMADFPLQKSSLVVKDYICQPFCQKQIDLPRFGSSTTWRREPGIESRFEQQKPRKASLK